MAVITPVNIVEQGGVIMLVISVRSGEVKSAANRKTSRVRGPVDQTYSPMSCFFAVGATVSNPSGPVMIVAALPFLFFSRAAYPSAAARA